MTRRPHGSIAAKQPDLTAEGGSILLTLKVWKEDDQYVSECIELGVTSCGDTIEEAFKNVREATLLYLSTVEEEGERQRVFAERGIEVAFGEPQRPRLVAATARPREYISAESIPLAALA